MKMNGIVSVDVEARRSPPNLFGVTGRKMGSVKAGRKVAWTETKNNWAHIESNKWIPVYAIDSYMPGPPDIRPIPYGKIKYVRHHIEMPISEQNRGSFAIVRVYAEPKADKPHSIFPTSSFIRSVKAINTPRGFQWLYEHDDNKFFGANYDDGSGYRVPTQGIFSGNLVRVLEEKDGFSRLDGIVGELPAGMTFLTNPELVHYCWCVDYSGQPIPPPGGVAYHPVLNPMGMKGSIVNGKTQDKIWVENKWLKDISE